MPEDGYQEYCKEHKITERWCAKHGTWEAYCPHCDKWISHGIVRFEFDRNTGKVYTCCGLCWGFIK